MRKIILFILPAVFLLAAAGQLKKKLGPDFPSLLEKPDKVQAFGVAEKEDESKKNISGFPVTRTGKVLTPAQTAMVAKILLNEGNYNFEMQKKCVFGPSLVLRFTAGKKTGDVLFCFTCKEVMFESGDISFITNMDAFAPVMAELKKSVLP